MKNRTSLRSRRSSKRSSGRVPRGIGNSVLATRLYQADIAKFAADSGLYRTFQPLLFPITDLLGSFTKYRIRSIKLEYQLYNQLNNNSTFPTLYVAPQQYSESATPSSITEVIQFKGLQTFQFGPSRPTYTRTFTPYVNITTTGPGRVPTPSPWISSLSDLPQHLTNVEWLQNYNNTTQPTHTIRLVATAIFEFSGTR